MGSSSTPFSSTQSINLIEFKTPPLDREIFRKKLLKSFGGFSTKFLMCFTNVFLLFSFFLFVCLHAPFGFRESVGKETEKKGIKLGILELWFRPRPVGRFRVSFTFHVLSGIRKIGRKEVSLYSFCCRILRSL